MERKREKKVEILAPAGSYDAFRAAVAAGADAVYAGGEKFGARANAVNFTKEELILAIREAHLYDRKFYLTVNTLLKDGEISQLYDYLCPLYENGLDAVIVQDAGVFDFVRGNFPDTDIHASTQMTITGCWGAKFLEEQGASRVVPARELSLEEIRQIHETTSLEIECFVHGALCYCYSGQCLLSSMIGGRSGNRGQCAQPCRQLYRHGSETAYYLSPKDICTLDLIPDMVDAGIYSFKIEGRMKKPEYVAGVTSIYKKYTDLYLKKGRKAFRVSEEDREHLMDLYNRGGSSSGYYKTHNGRKMISLSRPNHAGVPAVKITGQKGRQVYATAVTGLNAGDVIEITKGKDNHTLGSKINKGDSFSFLVQKQTRLPIGTVLNRVRNESLIRSLHEQFEEKKEQIPVTALLSLCKDKPGSIVVSCRGKHVCEETDEIIQKAKNRPVDKERILAQMNKTGGSEFYFSKLDVVLDPDIFVPMQQLNTLRRSSLEKLKQLLVSEHFRTVSKRKEMSGEENNLAAVRTDAVPGCVISVETVDQTVSVRDFICQNKYDRKNFDLPVERIYLSAEVYGSIPENQDTEQLLDDLKEEGCSIYIMLPHIFRNCAQKYEKIRRRILDDQRICGVLIRNYEEFGFLKTAGFDKKIILDHNQYIFNRYGRRFWNKAGVFEFTAPLELNKRELSVLGLSDAELTIYERFPVMISAQCIEKTHGGCKGKPGISVIRDRFGNQYPTERRCDLCYNIIYNDRPMYIGGEKEAIRELSPKMLGIRFTVENKQDVSRILKRVSDDLSQKGKTDAVSEQEYTEGHFRRGVL